ncbi:hypothetical protein PD280_06285 [Virgibacillus salarius]|uniref:hypothetical protein n=1 Tax=Virgibacillus salarius TaxID=447199 RepID=UPI002490EC19|nr:hypothetical protein [Virgibacillus salarius]WBX81326.1 hypothetical protein PD280_06285 [Virgibacillus salarius]
MRAIIDFEGEQYIVTSIFWNEDGSIAHLSFDDKDGEYRTIFKDDYYLENMITWNKAQ